MKLLRSSIFLMVVLIVTGLHAESNLTSEPLLHPGDSFTTDVFQKDGWQYGQPIIPAPGWAFWGVSDKLTVELDFMAWLFNIPDVNFRYALSSNPDNSLAIETMLLSFNNLPKDLNFDDSKEHLFIHRHGTGAYSRLIWGRKFDDWSIYSSLGVSYAENYRIENHDRPVYHGKAYRNLIEPVYSISAVHRKSEYVIGYINASYGETFVFEENRPRKNQLTYGFTIAPWAHSPTAFLRNLRMDFTALFIYYPDAKEYYTLPIPILPYLYWQWQN